MKNQLNRHMRRCNQPSIVIDYREKNSDLPGLLSKADFGIIFNKLPYCDYVINQYIQIERKTGKDFIASIIDGRLFEQARKMKKFLSRPFYIVEGHPLNTKSSITKESVQGAVISLQTIWYIPIIFTTNVKHTFKIIKMMAHQINKHGNLVSLRHGYRPKKLRSNKLYLLQGFPQIGPQLAERLLSHFSSIRNITNATEDELTQVSGIGSLKAKKIIEVLD